jgi:hypothetical protein
MARSGFVTLNEVKDQCSIERCNPTHDEKLEQLLVAAERAAVEFMNIDGLGDLQDSPPTTPRSIPGDVKSAILVHAQMHFDRNPDDFEEMQKAFERLLWPHRTGLGV